MSARAAAGSCPRRSCPGIPAAEAARSCPAAAPYAPSAAAVAPSPAVGTLLAKEIKEAKNSNTEITPSVKKKKKKGSMNATKNSRSLPINSQSHL